MNKIKKNKLILTTIISALVLTVACVVTVVSNLNSDNQNSKIYQSIDKDASKDKIGDNIPFFVNNIKKITPEKIDKPQQTKVAIKTSGSKKNGNMIVPLSSDWEKVEDGSDNMFVAKKYIFSEFGTQPSIDNGKNLDVKQMANKSISENEATTIDQFTKKIGKNEFLVTVMDVKQDNAYVVIYNKILNNNTNNASDFHAQVFFSKQVTRADEEDIYHVIANIEQSLSEMKFSK